MNKNKLLRCIGLILVVISLAVLLAGRLQNRGSRQENQRVAQQIEAILPPRFPGTQEELTIMDMPVLSLQGQDYIALLEVPALDVKLPVRSTWSSRGAQRCPSRFSGTVYDGTLVIGGSSQPGHLDFIAQLMLGDTITVTAMDGSQFRYRVTQITRVRSTPADLLMEEGWDLTLFARDSGTLDYILIRCQQA